jgi:hypothetical protein
MKCPLPTKTPAVRRAFRLFRLFPSLAITHSEANVCFVSGGDQDIELVQRRTTTIGTINLIDAGRNVDERVTLPDF